MMKKIFKAALVVAAVSGFQAMASTGVSAGEGGLMQYAKDPTSRQVTQFAPIKVASRRSRRRNRVIGGVFAAGVAAIILNEALRNSRKHDRYYYNDDRQYYRDSHYRKRTYSRRHYRQCRRLSKRCDYGVRRACKKWYRRCQ